MAELKRDRARASQLRKLKKLTPEQSKWLRDYEARVTISRAKRTPDSPTEPSSSVVESVRPPDTTKAPLLALPEKTDDAPPVVVQETRPVEGTISPDEATWTPIVTAPAEGETLPPGAEAPPPPGAPLFDEATAEHAQAAPQGDPAAAQQFAAFCMLVTTIGYAAVMELSREWPLPPELKMMAASDAARMATIQGVGAAASRVAVKYGFRSVPLADEAIVAGAIGGSVLAVVAVEKKKASAKKKPEASAASETSEAPPAPRAARNVPRAANDDASAAVAEAFAGDS